MAKQKGWSKRDKQKLMWFLATAYVADTVGLLDKKIAAKLASFESTAGPVTWQEQVRTDLDVDDAFVKKVFALCVKRKTPVQSIAFILNGLGCPETDEQLRDLFG